MAIAAAQRLRAAWNWIPRRPRSSTDVLSMMENNTGKFIAFCLVAGLAWVAFIIWVIVSVVSALTTIAANSGGGT